MSEITAEYETHNLDRDELLSNGFQCIYREQFEEAIRLFDRAIEIEPDLLTFQARALCETFLLTDHPNVSQVIKIISNLTEALRLAVEHVEIMPEITPDTWTAEKFKELISEQEYKETYYSKGKIERFSELGADLMNLVDKEQWKLTYRFKKKYFAFYFKGKPIFGINLNAFSPRLCIWLPEEIVIDRENDGETDSRHETYRDWISIGFAAYPTDVEVADLKALLNFTYLSRTDQLD